jgi:outer membrane cobalamin receptor
MPYRLFVYSFIFVIPSITYGASEDTTGTPLPKVDSIKISTDSTKFSTDSTTSVYTDTVYAVKAIPLIGRYEGIDDSSRSITGSQIPWIEYRYLGDLFQNEPGLYIRDMGSPGQQYDLTIDGADRRMIGVMVDGRNQNDPVSGAYDLMLFPVDYSARIEFISGPRAFWYGTNTTGASINIITKSYYTNKPYSRMRYSQGVNDYTQTDAIFSQNIFRGFNFTFGLARQAFGSKRGDQYFRGRFPNSNHDSWSFRTKMRYNITNSFDLVFTHLFHQTFTGLSGGVDFRLTPVSELFTDFGVTVSNYDAYEKRFNHHLDLTAVYHPGGDTTLTSTLTAYYSNQLRQYRDEENRYYANGIFRVSDHRSSTRGLLFKNFWETREHFLSLVLTGEQVQIESSPEIGLHRLPRTSAALKEEIYFLSPLTLAGFARLEHYRDKIHAGMGSDGRFTLSSGLRIFGGMSISARVPTLVELYWPDDSLQHPVPRSGLKDEKHFLTEAGLEFGDDASVGGRIAYFHRIISDPITADTIGPAGGSTARYLLRFSQGQSKTYNGLNASLRIRFGQFIAEGYASYLHQPIYKKNNTSFTLNPEYVLHGSFYFFDELFDGHLMLKSGFRGRVVSKQTGMAPLPESEVMVPYELLSYGPSATVDFFLIGHLGDAYIHLIWENLTNNEYMLTPVYPMYNSSVRFGVSWEFLD